jgi:hypothetical protein
MESSSLIPRTKFESLRSPEAFPSDPEQASHELYAAASLERHADERRTTSSPIWAEEMKEITTSRLNAIHHTIGIVGFLAQSL